MIGWLYLIVIFGALAHEWWRWSRKLDQLRQEDIAVPETPKPEEKFARHEYELTLMHPNGEFVGKVVTRGLPRHFYVCPNGKGYMSDDPEPPDIENVIPFDRIASAVHVDDERTALFVRRT